MAARYFESIGCAGTILAHNCKVFCVLCPRVVIGVFPNIGYGKDHIFVFSHAAIINTLATQ